MYTAILLFPLFQYFIFWQNGDTALISAAKGKKELVVATLLKSNANIEAINKVSYCDGMHTNGV